MSREITWSQERLLLKELAESSPILGWITDPDGYCVYLSPNWYRTTGTQPGEGEGFEWLNAIHDADRLGTANAFFGALQNRSIYSAEYRLTSGSGILIRALARGIPRFSGNGHFAGFLGLTIPLAIDEAKLDVPPAPVRQSLLSAREREVLGHIAAGLPTGMIAHRLGITSRTVEAHVKNAVQKLEASNRTHACMIAVAFNEIPLPPVHP